MDPSGFGQWTSVDKFKSSVSYIGQLDPQYQIELMEVASPREFPRQFTSGLQATERQKLFAFVSGLFPWASLPSPFKAILVAWLLFSIQKSDVPSVFTPRVKIKISSFRLWLQNPLWSPLRPDMSATSGSRTEWKCMRSPVARASTKQFSMCTLALINVYSIRTRTPCHVKMPPFDIINVVCRSKTNSSNWHIDAH